jgi:hypothetical protein
MRARGDGAAPVLDPVEPLAGFHPVPGAAAAKLEAKALDGIAQPVFGGFPGALGQMKRRGVRSHDGGTPQSQRAADRPYFERFAAFVRLSAAE